MTTLGSDRGTEDSVLLVLANTVRGSFSTVEDMTRAFIREAILKGIFRPGERLQQDAIAAILGVSRMPVRASLRQLESDGLVTFNAHRGATVATLSAAQVAEIYELRILLETFALEKAMTRLDADRLRELTQLAGDMDASQDPSEWVQHRQQFYARLYSYAERPETLELIRRLRSSVGPYLLLRRVVEEPQGHLTMLNYLEAGDFEAARAWLSAHLTKVSQELQRVVSEEHLAEAGQ